MDSFSQFSQISDEEIEKFLQSDIIDLMGLSNIDEEEKTKLRDTILDTIKNRVFKRLIEELKSHHLLKDFEEIVDEDESEAFLKKHEIDVEAMFIEEAIYYKAQLKSVADLTLKGVPAKAPKES